MSKRYLFEIDCDDVSIYEVYPTSDDEGMTFSEAKQQLAIALRSDVDYYRYEVLDCEDALDEAKDNLKFSEKMLKKVKAMKVKDAVPLD